MVSARSGAPIRVVGVFLSVLVVVVAGCDTGTNGESPWGDVAQYAVGDDGPAGGVIFFDKGNRDDGWRYLEASRADQSIDAIWAPAADFLALTDFRVGAGLTNTQKIVARHGQTGSYGALLCTQLTDGGVQDWYLPSRDELYLLYDHRLMIGGFQTQTYMSSTESGPANATGYDFSMAMETGIQKTVLTNYHVRAIRRF